MENRAAWRSLPGDPRTKLGWMRKEVEDRLSPPDLKATVPVPSAIHHFSVRIEVGQGSFVRGIDHGTVSFVDGWLHFEGQRTGFDLRRADIRWTTRQEGLTSLTLRDGSFVSFVAPAGSTGVASFGGRIDVHQALDRWHKEARHPTGESLLPPSSTLPNVFATAYLMISGGLISALIGPLAALRLQSGWLLFLVPAGLFLVLWGLVESAQLRADGAS